MADLKDLTALIEQGSEAIKATLNFIQLWKSNRQGEPSHLQKSPSDIEQLLRIETLVVSLQESYAALLERNRGLEKELAQMKDWAEEKKRYQLRRVGIDGQMLVYVLRKPFVQQGETPHEICAPCAEDGKKSFLTRTPADLMQPESPALLLTCPAHDVTMISVHADQLLST